MKLTRDEIIDYASRYVQREEMTDFPMDGDVFCLLARELPQNRVLGDEEGWEFIGYNLCGQCLLDEEAKPKGKWLWLDYVSLVVFPPQSSCVRLQPPHLVKGTFFDASRTREFKMLKVDPERLEELVFQLSGMSKPNEEDEEPGQGDESGAKREAPASEGGNILQFPAHRSKKE